MNDAFLIKKPWVTEKSTSFTKEGKYVFIVRPAASKRSIAEALKRLYKVDAVKVNIVNHPPKTKRMGALLGRQSGYKKAIVTLKQGQSLDLH